MNIEYKDFQFLLVCLGELIDVGDEHRIRGILQMNFDEMEQELERFLEMKQQVEIEMKQQIENG